MARDVAKLVFFFLNSVGIVGLFAVMIYYYAVPAKAYSDILRGTEPADKQNIGLKTLEGALQNMTDLTGMRTIRAPLEANIACVSLVLLGLLDWIVYTLLTIVKYKSSIKDRPVYMLEGVQHLSVLVNIKFAIVLCGAYYLCLNQGYFTWVNLLLLALAFFCMTVSVFKAALDHEKYREVLIQAGVANQLFLVKAFVVNAILPFSAWMFISLFTGVTELIWQGSIAAQQNFMAAILGAIICGFFLQFLIEVIFIDYGFYHILHYVVFFMYAVGLTAETWSLSSTNPVFILAILCVVLSVLQVIGKLVLIAKNASRFKNHTPI